MNWRDWYPEGSTVFVGRESYLAKHNEHGLGLDLYKDGELAMTITPEYVPVIADGVKFPTEKQP
ncbi:hypothetical protein [Shinella granuli]|uniref:Uncharacterized protein n=1 Tax=Shinella granuli TaxID=323621 RepID=A0A4R2D1A6_SHIGR|nr:hypothetical protein [Shinella granuli]TCN47491.1 hypothetical protein EV665_1028 [Shinella granuli]